MAFKFFDDSEGNQSSKRLVGFLMVGFSMVLTSILFYASFSMQIPSQNILLDLVYVFVYSGSSLLGIGVLENFSKSK